MTSIFRNIKINNQLLRDLLRVLPVYLYTKDRNHRFTYVSSKFSTLLGLQRQDILRKTINEILNKSAMEKNVLYKHDQKVLKTGKPVLRVIESFPTPNGKVHVRSWKIPLAEQEQVIGMLNLSLNVTDDVLSEQLMSQQIILLQTIIDAIPHPISYKDSRGRYLIFNHALETSPAIAGKEILGKNAHDLFTPFMASFHTAQDSKVMKRLTPITYQDPINADNPDHCIIHKKTPFINSNGDPEGIISISMMDVSNTDTSRDIMLSRNLFLNLLMDQTDEAIVLLDDGIIVDSNRQAHTFFGCEKKDLLGNDIIDFMPDCQLDSTACREQFTELLALAYDKKPQALEWVFSKRDQISFVATISIVPIELTYKKLCMLIIRDVSENREKASQLMASRHTIDSIMELSSDGMAVMKDGVVVKANKKFLEIMKCDNLSEMLLAKNMPFFCNDSGITKDFLSHMAALERPARNIEFTAVINGQFMFFQISANSIDYYGEESVMVCVKDITGSKVIVETLTRENYRQQELTGYSLEPFFEASPDGDLTYLNQAAKSLLNHNAGCTTTRQANILSFISPLEHERFHSHMLSLRKGKQKGAVHYTVVRADGSTFPIVIMAVPAINAAGNTYIRGLIRNISQIRSRQGTSQILRKPLSHRLRKLRGCNCHRGKQPFLCKRQRLV